MFTHIKPVWKHHIKPVWKQFDNTCWVVGLDRQMNRQTSWPSVDNHKHRSSEPEKHLGLLTVISCQVSHRSTTMFLRNIYCRKYLVQLSSELYKFGLTWIILAKLALVLGGDRYCGKPLSGNRLLITNSSNGYYGDVTIVLQRRKSGHTNLSWWWVINRPSTRWFSRWFSWTFPGRHISSSERRWQPVWPWCATSSTSGRL